MTDETRLLREAASFWYEQDPDDCKCKGCELFDDAASAALSDPVPAPEVEGPRVTWTPANRTALVVMAPIADGLCSGCGTRPSMETGSCRCLFRVDAAIRGQSPVAERVYDAPIPTSIEREHSPVAERVEGLDVPRLARALHDVYCYRNYPMHSAADQLVSLGLRIGRYSFVVTVDRRIV